MPERLLICVVDDDDRLRLSLGDLLLGAGFEVMLATCAEEFLDSPESETCECVITDVRMPGIGGLELLRQFRRYRSVPVVVISAHDTSAVRDQINLYGSTCFIEKPFDANRLIDVIVRMTRAGGSGS